MILEKLYECADNIIGEDMPPPMYETKPVRWFVDIGSVGQVAIRSNVGEDKRERGLPVTVPFVGRTSGIRPILLADTPAYVFGVALPDKQGSVDKNASAKHAAFRSLLRRCAEETGDEGVGAVLRTFESPLTMPSEMGPGDLVTFRYRDRWVVDSPAVQRFWAKTARGEEDLTNAFECLVTGAIGPVDESLSQMIKGLPGGQTSGVALVSANAGAFESHGLKRAQTSPMTRDAGERIVKSLNRLISGENSKVKAGNVIYVFWTKDGPDTFVPGMLNNPDEQQVRELINSPITAKHREMEDDNAREFYVFALSANAARVVIRDQIATTLGNVRSNLKKWFEAQSIIGTDGEPGRSMKLWTLGAAAYRDGKDMEPGVVSALARSALNGDPIPAHLIGRVVMRCRADRSVTHPRAALIKMILSTDKEAGSIPMTTLNRALDDPAYLCGRLLAQLAAIQRAALGDINANVVDRFYGAASTAPASVMPLLLNMATKAHLPKLRKTRPNWHAGLERQLMEITEGLTSFPKILTLEKQGMFALGFYHQKADDRAAAKAKSAENAARKNDDDLDETESE